MQAGTTPGLNQRPWIVLKFGGTSVSSARNWSTIAAQARRGMEDGCSVLIVVSALSGITDLLTRISGETDSQQRKSILDEVRNRHEKLVAELALSEPQELGRFWRDLETLCETARFPLESWDRAALIAHGELLSSALGFRILEKFGLNPALQDARSWLEADPRTLHNPLAVRSSDHVDPDMQIRLGAQGNLHITQGFIVSGPGGRTCLLGRGGSDTSAACFAARLNARSLEIWTDVPGMFSADPRVVPDARLLRSLGYMEAQELASMGAKVLHPPSIQPARRHGIPVHIKDTNNPELPGTCIQASDREAEAQVKGVVSRKGITLINMASPDMWRQAGFLADAFAVFKKHGYSVDLISTSESAVTVSLDPESASSTEEPRFESFLDELSSLCQVELHTGCVSISLVGRSIRTILGKLSAALDVFQDRHIHMVTQSANDLNLTLVLDAEHADILVRKLHQILVSAHADHRSEFGPSWSALKQGLEAATERPVWWRQNALQLLDFFGDRESAYVYHAPSTRLAARKLKAMGSISRVLYSVKANAHPNLIRVLAGEDLDFECVSLPEVEHVLASDPSLTPQRILFTPNFAPRAEYEQAFRLGVTVTVDNAWAIRQWPEVFAGREVFLRLDLERGYGHHKKVITSGKDSKFGIDLADLDELSRLLSELAIKVVGLHVHTGSGVSDAAVWREQLMRLMSELPRFPGARVLDLGGGISVPERPGQPNFDLDQLDSLLQETKAKAKVDLWIEPGRYLVAESGVLLARVTQLKDKAGYHYVGIATGMNSLIRPALYGAYHEIVNLTRIGDAAEVHCRIVGPICESGDVLGEKRFLPACREGDVLLIANVGAYGRVMASHYNHREPAKELFFEG